VPQTNITEVDSGVIFYSCWK